MAFARKVWKLLVGIKDGLALLFLLLFFLLLYSLLTMRPGPSAVQEGALLLTLDGVIVEEPRAPDPFTTLLTGRVPVGEYRSRDIIRALRLAAADDRVKAVALDLSGFLGGGFVSLQDIGDALDEVRASGKPVLTYGIAYVDDGMLLAAHADEVWVDPMGGAIVTGPGSSNLYFANLLERLNVTAHIFRVGTFKSAVEPWTLSEPSPEAREAYQDLFDTIWSAWRTDFNRARPKADLDLVTTDPLAWFRAAGGDPAEAARSSGLIDRIGSRTQFGLRVAEIVGENPQKDTPGEFAHTKLDTWLAANPERHDGKAIGVVTIAGEIVDGGSGPGVAGSDRIVRLLNEGLNEDYAALVVRVDTPGGSVIASERIREAIARYTARDIPVVVSMANLAASGGYWVSTPAQRIFAAPGTITGSIGVFAVLPTFERALAGIGVNAQSVGTTPLSGQPDLLGGLSPAVSPMIQAYVEDTYGEFVDLVRQTRGLNGTPVESWAEGRPWAGATARQLGLVDEFGGLEDALNYAARTAGLEDGEWHADFMGGELGPVAAFVQNLLSGRVSHGGGRHDIVGVLAQRQLATIGKALADAERVAGTQNLQAYCIECPVSPSAASLDSAREPLSAIARIFASGLGFMD